MKDQWGIGKCGVLHFGGNNCNNKKPKSNLEKATSPPLTEENNYATKSPLVTMGCPIYLPKTSPFPSTISTPSNTPIPRPTPHTTPNGIQMDGISRFATVRFLDRQTDRQTQTNTWDERHQFQEPLTLNSERHG